MMGDVPLLHRYLLSANRQDYGGNAYFEVRTRAR
jgi:hypothetical protein